MKLKHNARTLCAISLLALTLVGCATRAQSMTEAEYLEIGSFRAWTKLCFDAQMMTPREYADSEGAIDVHLTRRTYDSDYLHAKTMAVFNREVANPAFCREVQAKAYNTVRTAGIIQSNRAEARAAASYSTPMPQVQKPIWCNRIGSTTMCN